MPDFRRFLSHAVLKTRTAGRRGLSALGVPGERFECPICGYHGLFVTAHGAVGVRSHAFCPRCLGAERHRLQYVVVSDLIASHDFRTKRCLQFAPDPVTPLLRSSFGELVTADIDPAPGSIALDMRALALPDASFDFVFASHVLEHIDDDERAVRELYRVLRPGGLAVLPVPIVCEHTVEYPEPMPLEEFHVRAPGLDYFDKYRAVFDRVEVITSAECPPRFQPYIYEDRSGFPSPAAPYRTAMAGPRHLDAVPVCRKD